MPTPQSHSVHKVTSCLVTDLFSDESDEPSEDALHERDAGNSLLADDSDDDSETFVTSKKRKRSAAPSTSSATILGRKDGARPAKRVRGKRGFLQQVTEMPLELLYEIFSKLDPMDLLNLARTTKALRAILMQEPSRGVWEAALANVPDLPPCPEDLTEPQWVDLLYGKNCHVCGRTTAINTQTYAWEVRIRGCFKCIFNECRVSTPELKKHPRIAAVTPAFEVENETRGRYKQGTHYHTIAFHELLEAYKLLADDVERTEWRKEKRAAKADLTNHACLCKSWLDGLREARANELCETRTKRKSVLRGKVERLGYSPAMIDLIFDMPHFWKVPCVSSLLKKVITERVWVAAEGAFVEVMNRCKSNLEERQRKATMNKRYDLLIQAHKTYVDSLPIDEPVFTVGDLFQRPFVKATVVANPLHGELDPKFLKGISKKMSKYNQAWLGEAKQTLVDILKSAASLLGLEEDAVDGPSLRLAVAFFACSKCNKRGLRAVDLLHHACARFFETYDPWERRSHTPNDADEHIAYFVSQTNKCPWNFSHIFFFDSGRAKSAIALINRLGLEAKTLTMEALDNLDPIFEQHSTTGSLGRVMYSWRGLLEKSDADADGCSILNESTSTVVRELLDEDTRREMASESRYRSSSARCKHCRNFTGNSGDLVNHLNDKHDIRAISGEDVWFHPDSRKSRTSITYYKHAASTTALI